MAIDVGSAIGYLDLDTSGFNKGFSSAMNDLKVFQAKGSTTEQKLKGLSSSMNSVGSTLTKGVTLPIVGVGAAIVKMSSDFDFRMSAVKAIAQASTEDLAALKEEAISLGASTSFSANEVADAMTEMAKAGWETQQILDGMGGVLDAAAASGEDLGSVATIVADAITGFGLSAANATDVADLLTQSANAGTLDVSDLGEAFKYVAPVAQALGYSIEDVTIAVSAMSMAGIKGSQSGTTLRAALTNMVKPTKSMEGVMKDLGIEVSNQDGSMKTLKETMDMLREKFAISTPEVKKQRLAMYENQMIADGLGGSLKGLTEEQKYFKLAMYEGTRKVNDLTKSELKKQAQDMFGINITKQKLTEQQKQTMAMSLGTKALDGLTQAEQAAAAATLFGKEAMSGMLSILNLNEEAYEKVTDQMYNAQGVARETADVMQDNLTSDVEQLGGALESLSIRLGALLMPALRKLVVDITSVIEKFTMLDQSTQKTILKIAGIVAAIGPALLVGSKLIDGILALKTGLGVLGTGFSSLLTLIKTGGLIPAITGIGASIGPVILVIAGVVAAVVALKAAWKTNFGGIRDFTKEMAGTLGSILSGIKAIFVSVVETIKDAWESNFMGIQTAVKFVLDQVEIYLKGMFDFWSNIFKAIEALIHGDFSGAMDFLKKAVKGAVDAVKTVLKNMFDAFSNILRNIIDFLKPKMIELADKMKEGASNAVKGFLKFLNELPGKVGEIVGFVLGTIVKFVIEFPAKAKEAALNFKDNFVNGIKTLPGKAKETLDNVIKNVKSFAKDFGGKAKEAAADFGKKLKNGLKEVPGAMKEIGKNIVSGIWEGIKSAGGWMKDKISDFAGGIVSGFKSALGIHSPSKVAETQIGKNIALGVAAGITKNTKKAKKAAKDLSAQIVAAAKVKISTLKEANKVSAADEVLFWKTIIGQTKAGTKARLDAEKQYTKAKKTLAKEEETIAQKALSKAEKRLATRKVYNEVSIKSEMNYWDRVRKQTKEGTDARIEADKKYFEAKKSYTEQLTNLEEQYRQNQLAIKEQLKSDIDSLTKAYTDAVDSRTNSILGSFSLFSAYTTKVKTDSKTLIDALQSQVDALGGWEQQLAKLEGRRILPKDLITEISNMGVDASGQIEALNSMTDEELAKYVELWGEKNKLARERAIKELAPMAKETATKIQELKVTANSKLKELKTVYTDNLKALGVSAKAAAKKAGKDTVSGIITGLNNKKADLSKTLDNIASMVSSKIASINASIAAAQKAANSLSTKAPSSAKGKSHRNGLDYVPYDGYVAELHEGERVLTKQENSNLGTGGNIYNFYGTQPLDEKETARQFKKAQQQLALNV